ncbi:zinc finger protein 1-like [Ananas comosus]|uniref:Zinc finger protein 1-like n=1 Tax=Ananas comosus TaxID=4615 RepID=A0A6P5EG38_ANACO|nr:zinc finger protein 1-like [Ananas comosus]
MVIKALFDSTTLSNPLSKDDYLALCLVMLGGGGGGGETRRCGGSGCLSAPTMKLRYACSVCGKTFESYQALGGHKSSHRRPVGPVQACKPSSGRTGPDDSGQVGPHRCSVCCRSFMTGQALGGHKRCHYWEGASTSSSSAAPSGSSVRDFDLNLPPPTAAEIGARRWMNKEDEEEVQSPLAVKKPRLPSSA